MLTFVLNRGRGPTYCCARGIFCAVDLNGIDQFWIVHSLRACKIKFEFVFSATKYVLNKHITFLTPST